MTSDWFVPVQLRMTREDFQKLPQHPAYRYDYTEGELHLSGCPVLRNCRIETRQKWTASQEDHLTPLHLAVRGLQETPKDRVVELFRQAFRTSTPYCTLSSEKFEYAIQDHFQQVLSESSWPVVWEASHAVVHEETGEPVGVGLVTLVPSANWSDFTDPRWQEPPPEKALEARWGTPHLTWLFVSPDFQRCGIAAVLLSGIRKQLNRLGYPLLYSTVQVGDHGSQFWHWKQGFELISSALTDSER
ncbi:MAG TPA: GNAT family N-acetyltransferase [Planctomicrobium sp.]|nr:GNAT family N-acetyltransferase [Planctomicrobium sp.]